MCAIKLRIVKAATDLDTRGLCLTFVQMWFWVCMCIHDVGRTRAAKRPKRSFGLDVEVMWIWMVVRVGLVSTYG